MSKTLRSILEDQRLPVTVNVTLLNAVLSKFQDYFEPHFRELIENSKYKLPPFPERPAIYEGNQWSDESIDLINSDSVMLLVDKHINCRAMR